MAAGHISVEAVWLLALYLLRLYGCWPYICCGCLTAGHISKEAVWMLAIYLLRLYGCWPYICCGCITAGHISVEAVWKLGHIYILMYSASTKGCNKPGCRLQTVVNSRYQDFPPIPRGCHNFPPCPECIPVDFPPSRSGNKPLPQG